MHVFLVSGWPDEVFPLIRNGVPQQALKACLDIPLGQRLFAVKAMQENLACCHGDLRQLQEHARLLDQLTAIHSGPEFIICCDTVLSRRAVFQLFGCQVKVVKCLQQLRQSARVSLQQGSASGAKLKKADRVYHPVSPVFPLCPEEASLSLPLKKGQRNPELAKVAGRGRFFCCWWDQSHADTREGFAAVSGRQECLAWQAPGCKGPCDLTG